MAFGSLLKIALGCLGTVVTLILLTIGISRRDNSKLMRAAITFLSTFAALLAISIIEFWILDNLQHR